MTTKTNLEWISNDSPLPDPHGFGERAVKFIKALRHPKSSLPKKQFQLDPWHERNFPPYLWRHASEQTASYRNCFHVDRPGQP